MNAISTLRLLRAADLPALRAMRAMRAMLDVFGRAFDDRKTYLGAQPDDRYLADLLSSDGFVAIAALRDSIVVGGLAGYVLPKIEQARSEFYIQDLPSTSATDARAWPRR